MAYLEPQIYEEEDNPGQTAGGTISGSSVAARPSAKPSSTGYVNVQRYVDANKPGIESFAKDIGSKVGEQQTGAQKATGQLLSDFEAAQGPDINYGQLGKLLGTEGVQEGEEEGIKGALAAGKGPRQLNEMGNYSKALAEHQKAMEMLNLAEGQQGTSGYGALAQLALNPQQYTRGMRGLDASLLAAQKDFPTSFAAGGGGAAGGTGADRFVGGGRDYFDRAEKQASELGRAGQERFNTGLGLLKESAGGRLSGLEAQLKAQQEAAGQAFTKAEQSQFDDYINQLYQPLEIAPNFSKGRVDIAPYIQATQLPARHFGQFATADQAKEFDLLKQLIDPSYTLGTGGYGDVPMASLDKKAYEQAVLDKFLSELTFPPAYTKEAPLSSQGLEEQVAASQRANTKSYHNIGDALATGTEGKAKYRKEEEKKHQRPFTSFTRKSGGIG